jgi:hypothetical protein
VWPDVKKYRIRNPFNPDVRRAVSLHISKILMQEIDALDCDVVWCTTWGRFANPSFGALVGAPEWESIGDVTDYSGYSSSGELIIVQHPAPNWKCEAIRQHQEANPRPYIFADDELLTQEAQDWLKSEIESPSLFVVPTPEEGGLIPQHIDLIEEFIVKHS